MTFLLALLLAAAPDGGVPTVEPRLTPALAPLLAPELVPRADGTVAPVRPTLSVYDVNVPAELALTAGAIGLAAIVDVLIKPSLEGDTSCRRDIGNGRCDPDDLSAFDRYAVGKVSPEWTAFSDVTLYASILLPTIYLGLESLALPTTEPFGDWTRDLLVVSEAMALTAVIQTVLKFAFRRPRPVRYRPVDSTTASFDHELSFPSGHTSMVAAATTALTTTLFLRHPESKVRFVILGSGILLSGLTALARVESGNHFPTDVITGLGLGAFAGLVVPWLHKRKAPISPIASFDPATGSSMLGLSGSF